MTFNGQRISQFAKNVAWAVVIGSGGSLLLNTVRRDSERAQRLLGYAAVSGLAGASIGFTYGMMRRQHPVVFTLSAGSGVFAISGIFFGESTMYTVVALHILYINLISCITLGF